MESLAEARARAGARELLAELWVSEPGHIELPALAARKGLIIHEGGLETAEGRIVAGPYSTGHVRVRAGIKNEGRRRFVIGHEIGHRCLHKRQSYTDTVRELTSYRDRDPEAEANIFSAELLMPGFLFVPSIKLGAPSHAFMQTLAEKFSTSHLATLVQYLSYTKEPCALVYTQAGLVRWVRKSGSWEWFIRDGAVHAHSGAGDFFNTGSTPKGGMIGTPAYAWLTQFSARSEAEIKEDVFVWPEYQVALSFLWVDGDL